MITDINNLLEEKKKLKKDINHLNNKILKHISEKEET